jgi:magnesium transporter
LAAFAAISKIAIMDQTKAPVGTGSPEDFRRHLLRTIETRDLVTLRHLADTRSPARLAHDLEDLPDEAEAIAFRSLPKKSAAQVFEYLDHPHQYRLLHALGQKEVASILEEMSADDRTAALSELPTAIQKQLLAELSPEEREVARTLLGYPKGSVGRLMTPEYVALSEKFTVTQALNYIRSHGQDSDTVNVVYVVKATDELVGSLRIRSLIMSDPEKPVLELILADVPQLFAGDLVGKAAETFNPVDLYALPVVDSSGKMLGIVTADDVLQAAQQEATREVQKIGGSAPLEVPYLETTIIDMLWKRGPWLIVLFIGGMFTANAMVQYETQIEKAVVLAVFLPLIIASGGNSGSQSGALVIRALGLGD